MTADEKTHGKIAEGTDADDAFAPTSAGAYVDSGEAAPAPSDDADVEVEREEGAPTVAELDPETRAKRDAALGHVRKLGDPVLRARAVPVDKFDERLAAEVERMGELMVDALGVGLAATQLGILHRVLVYRVNVEDPVTVLVNPEIEWSSEELEIEAEALTARVIQHEIDHLDGILILDRISRAARKEAMREMREAREARSAV